MQSFAGIQIYAPSRVQTNFEFDVGGNSVYQKKQRIAADDSRIMEETLYLGGFAVYTRTDTPGLASETKLTTILKGHLGSTDVLYTGTWNGSDFTNPQSENQSFDPWGERRDPSNLVAYRATDADPFRTSTQDYDRGYTGREQLDDSGLIHMNGRLYDPELGRMLSPDPVVQAPESS